MARLPLFPAVLMVLAAAPGLQAQTAPAPAKDLIAAAVTAAKPGNRTVLVAFHASWCSWCKRLEGVLAKPAVKEIMDRHFVTQWLTIQERGEKKVLDNPGAAELYQQWTGGGKSGIPFYLVLDAKGAMVSSSIRGAQPENIGYPGTASEINSFIGLLKDGAPSLSQAESEILFREFDAAKPKG